MKRASNSIHLRGFTIVELLIVVVVIAILAAITLVAFNNVTNRAKNSAASSAAQQAFKKVAVYVVDNADQPPVDLATAGVTDQNGTSYQYRTYNGGKNFCITATTNSISSYIDNDTHQTPTPGACAGHGAGGTVVTTNLVLNPGIEIDYAGWGPYRSATLSRSTAIKNTGNASLQVATPGVQVQEGVNLNLAGSGAVGTAGTYRASVWVRATSGAALRLTAEEWDGSPLAYVSGTIQAFTGTGSWQRVSVSRVAANPTSKVIMTIRTVSTLATTFTIDDAMITYGDTLYTYANGDSSGWIWNGPVNGSTSSGPAL